MQDQAIHAMVNGVYVLTAHHQGKMNGTTVAWATQVSFDPLLIMVSLADVRYSHGLVKKSGFFGLNVLGRDQVELARHFGFKSAWATDKMHGVGFSTSSNGVPILDDALAFLECRVVDAFPAGDHTMFVGELAYANVLKSGQEPMSFKREDYF